MDNNSFGNGLEGLLYFGIVAMMLTGGNWGGGWGNNGFANAIGYENLATSNEVQRGFDNQNQMALGRDILDATNRVYHDTVAYVGDKYNELARDIYGVNTMQVQGFGTTQRMIADAGASLSAQIAQNKYENALSLAGLEQRITAKLDANEIQGLRDHIQRLELKDATNGMLRFPNQWSYGAGPFPPIFGGCGGCNGNGFGYGNV